MQVSDFEKKYLPVLKRMAELPQEKVVGTIRLSKDNKDIYQLKAVGRWKHFFQEHFRKKEKVHDLQELKSFFHSVLEEVRKNPQLATDENKTAIQQAFEGLKTYYGMLEGRDSVRDIIQKNDILEALSVAYGEQGFNEVLFKEKPITRIQAKPLADSSEAVKSTANKISRFFKTCLLKIQERWGTEVLLTSYQDLHKAFDAIQNAEKEKGRPLEKDELLEVLTDYITKEDVPKGALIDLLYRHRFAGKEALNEAMTKIAAYKFGSKEKREVEEIIKFFKSLHITPVTTYKGELYSYSEVFGEELHKPRSYNEAFGRWLTEKMAGRYLEEAHKKDEEIQQALGDKSQSVVCNSFCNMTCHSLGKGQIATSFPITGKLLGSGEENPEGLEGMPGYEKLQFSLKEAFGFERSQDLSQPVKARSDRKEGSGEVADRNLLRSVANLLDDEESTMVVQRLAPQHVHRFILPVNGKILTREETCKALLDELEKKQGYGKKNAEEIEQLQSLLDFFKNEKDEKIKTHPSIDIAGEKKSVSRKALFEESAILASNDRRFVCIQDKQTGALSFHFYVGATGVDRVELAPPEEGKEGREVHGVMLPGKMPESQRKIPSVAQPYEISISSDTEEAGSFGLGGSTVISLYFKKDVVPEPKLHQFLQKTQFTQEKREGFFRKIGSMISSAILRKPKPAAKEVTRNIEMQMEVGNVICLPTHFVAWKALEEIVGKNVLKDLYEIGPNEEIFRAIVYSCRDNEQVPQLLLQQRALINTLLVIQEKRDHGEKLTYEENDLFTKLCRVIEHKKTSLS